MLCAPCCVTALLLLYFCFTAALQGKRSIGVLLYGFTAALLLLYCCFTAALLLLYCCFTAALQGKRSIGVLQRAVRCAQSAKRYSVYLLY